MINFRIMLDISNVYKEIKHLNLKKYNSPFPTIFLTATDPDDACVLVFDLLIKIIIDQDPSIKMRIICRKLKQLSKIDKLEILN